MKLPVIHLLKKDQNIYAFNNEKQLKTCGIKSLKIFEGSEIIDSEGTRTFVTKAYQTGWGTWFWGFNPLLKERTISIDFEIKGRRQTSIEDLKTLLIERIHSSKQYAKHMYFDLEKDELIALVTAAKSFQQLIELFIYDPTMTLKR